MGRKNQKKSNRKSSAKRQPSLQKGRFEITRSGMGFVVVEGMEKDIIIRPNDFNKAFHGDLVRVELTKGDSRAGRVQGKIVQVIERKQKQFIGTVEVNKDFAFFIPETERPIPDFYISTPQLKGAKDGNRVIVQLVSWDESDKRPKGELVEIITVEMEADIAMKELLIQQGFSVHFSDEVVEESERISDTITDEEIAKRRDMRDVLTFTIDPEDAKDFDDAISFSKIDKNTFEIGVHIADVSHFIEQGSALDLSAYERATSVYLPDRVVPMLPERLSNELCSLRPHEEKLTYSCIFHINTLGDVKEKWIGRTVIHSNHRFSYEGVQQIIEKGEGLYDEEVLVLNSIAQSLRKKRMLNGAINFSSQEVRFRLDTDGKPIGVMIKESNESHQLIEEFMLLANRTVAEKVSETELDKKPIPFPYRIHDQPDEAKLIPFVELAKKYGYPFSTKSPNDIAKSFNDMLNKVKGLPEQHVLEQMGIRTMAKAAYTSKNIGHFGLGFEHYCHFTSPIRRYPDILVHRVLTDILKSSPVVDKKMEQRCVHSSERERAAMECERAANKYKQVEYMRDFLGDEFDAVISGVASFGFWAETVEHKCEGLVSSTSLLDYDDFVYFEHEYALIGRRSKRAFRIGDRVRIKVVAANLTKRQLDYEWVLETNFDVPPSNKKKK
jgi:ribonuclease R